jgi:hypothetical protein
MNASISEILLIKFRKSPVDLSSRKKQLLLDHATISNPPGRLDLHEKWGSHRCEDERHKEIEDYLLKELIRGEQIQDDMPVLSELRVPMRISGNTYDDFGLKLEVVDTNGKA